MSVKQTVIAITSCDICPHSREVDYPQMRIKCTKLERELIRRSPFSSIDIPEDCPLDDYQVWADPVEVENLTKEEAEDADRLQFFDTETKRIAYVIWQSAAMASHDMPIEGDDEKFLQAREEANAYYQEWLGDE